MSEAHSMYDLYKECRQELREQVIEYRRTINGDEINDIIWEIADSNTPISIWDILQYAANNIALAVDEPEIGPAFDGSPTPVNIIAANIYEAIEADLWEYWQEELEEKVTELENEEEEDTESAEVD